MTRLLVSLAALVLLAAAGAGATSGEAADTTAVAQTTGGPPPVVQMTPSRPPANPPCTFGTFLSDNHEAFRTYGLIMGGVAGLIFAFWRARIATRQAEAAAARADAAIDQAQAANEQARADNEQARIAEQGHITDRFSTAVEHLGGEQLPVRLGGIYALWRLIKDSPERDVISVIDILCAFVRDPPHPRTGLPDPDASKDKRSAAEKGDEADSTSKLRPDVQTVLNLLGTKKAVYRRLLPAGYRLDFTGADLSRANLTGADLSRANLTDANLTGARLTDANLSGAQLTIADLTDAFLTDADLTGARLTGANLSGAHLRGADLTRADLWLGNLTRADLTDANLTDANLWLADNPTQEQLDSACISEGGKPPHLPEGEGLKPPQKVCVPLTR